MRKIVLTVAFICAVLDVSAEGNGKKVYADYHGVRYTRSYDGKLGRWGLYANTEKSATGRKTLCYNADLVDENGRHEIAAVAYPQVGMQSNLDPDYIEYQILSAKTAEIDGFFIEWGYMRHENDVLLRAMQGVAAKYDFEIGVNWCDGWLYYDWITKMYPQINTREKKTEHLATCYQFLIDSVFRGATAPLVKGRPVLYLFGAGATPDEWKKAASEVTIPQDMAAPVVLRRWAEWGSLQNDTYIPVTTSPEIEQWKALGAIPTAWLPARVRARDDKFPDWDNYALSKDLIEFMKPFRDQIWQSDNAAYSIKSGFVMPGMDNSGCAGWGRGHFYYIPRAEGETYRQMWEFNMASKEDLDMIFIASWSDYTEGHEIEPTVENGNRELKTTLKYASEFKQTKADEQGLELPLQLFQLRKKVELLERCGKSVSALSVKLDNAAKLIAKRDYAQASAAIDQTTTEITQTVGALKTKKMIVREDECKYSTMASQGDYRIGSEFKITMPDGVAYELTRRYYTGYITFEYLDDNDDFLKIYSQTERQPKDLFGMVASIKGDNSGSWRKARIELYKQNISLPEGRFSFRFTGGSRVRNIGLEFETYR